MLKTASISTDDTARVLNQALGEEVVVLGKEQAVINNWISAEIIAIEPSAVADRDAHGRMLLLPIDDTQQALRILYFFAPTEAEARIVVLTVHPDFFTQWLDDWRTAEPTFRFDHTTEHQFGMDPQMLLLLDALFAAPPVGSPFAAALLHTETALHLLRRTVEAIHVPFAACPVPACRFLVIDAEREKVLAARDILLAGTERPLTIKELARKVGMNECYLKKGFKALTGKTVHEFQHERRMARAVELLQSGNSNVSDVALELGFLSISHFSTAFKKATGMKACELLK